MKTHHVLRFSPQNKIWMLNFQNSIFLKKNRFETFSP
eukprot:UN19600